MDNAGSNRDRTGTGTGTGDREGGLYTPRERDEVSMSAVEGEILTTLGGQSVPPHSASDAVGICSWSREDGDDDESCSEMCVIAQSSIGFISSAAGISRENALLCDDHLNARIGGVTLDLSIGGAHTRSEEFEQQRKVRQGRVDDDQADSDGDGDGDGDGAADP